MEINIKPTSECCQYYIDAEKGVVVCRIVDTKFLVYNFIGPDHCQLLRDSKINRHMMMPASFTGVARCAPGDTFNEAVGRELAYTKARTKLNTSFFKRANYFVNEIDRRVGELTAKFNKYGTQLENNHEKHMNHLKELIGENKEE